ncbi:MAG: 1-acyl-sn-glycerol-3-phosphate acyltransferase [Acholeplasmatales bacterium]|jgi:1-acyl-sn-glycerol-3-phosphate acyltransferase|nr:1-acyl-sn-glycerol-3-phosphate acyltransferase [Acholeplasmatales bacterium]
MNKFVLWFTKITAYIPSILYFKKKVIYLEKKEKINKKLIIISNHGSAYDIGLLMFLLFKRDFYFLAGEEIYKKKLLAWFSSSIGGIKVQRDKIDMSFINKGSYLLNNDKALVVFPESMFNNNTDLEYKANFIYLSLKSEAPILPLYIDPNYGFFKFKRTKVVVGKKIYLKDLWDFSKDEKENISYLTSYFKNYVGMLKTRIK